MDPSLLFTICSTAVMPFWALLVVAPRWEWTTRLVHSCIIAVAFGLVYLVSAVLSPAAPEGADFGSLEGVMLLFSTPESVLVGWVHYLVFDLFVGAWIARDAQRRDISHWLVVPCLFFTLMAGPVGLLLYCTLRAAITRTGTFVET